MLAYSKPSICACEIDAFVVTQGSGEIPLIPLDCEGRVGLCDVSSLGASCSCGTLNMSFLVPGVNCSDINQGAACSISPVCISPQISVTECSEGCVVEFTCGTGNSGCDLDNFTASCPGFETCQTNAGSDNC